MATAEMQIRPMPPTTPPTMAPVLDLEPPSGGGIGFVVVGPGGEVVGSVGGAEVLGAGARVGSKASSVVVVSAGSSDTGLRTLSGAYRMDWTPKALIVLHPKMRFPSGYLYVTQ